MDIQSTRQENGVKATSNFGTAHLWISPFTKALFSLLTVAGILLIAEGATRLFQVEAPPVKPRQFFLTNFEPHNTRHYRKDPKLFWRLKPSIEGPAGGRINSRGFRSPEFSQTKKQGTCRIIAIGDSCTYGLGAKNTSNTYCGQLEDKLREHDIAAEVINAGVPGYSSYQGLVLLREELLALQPDLILVRFGLNDYLYAESVPDKIMPITHPALLRLEEIIGHSRFCRLRKRAIEKTISKRSENVEKLDRRVSLEDFDANLTEMVRLARSANADVIILNNPLRKNIPLVWNARPAFFKKNGRLERHWIWIGEMTRPGFLQNPSTSNSVEDIKTALAQWPDWDILHYFLAQKYEAAGLDDLAELEYKKAIELDEDRAVISEYNLHAEQVAWKEGAQYIDLATQFEKLPSSEYFADERHETEAGHALIAQLVAENILRIHFPEKSR
jgi:lysophospholipase L1-like esterase